MRLLDRVASVISSHNLIHQNDTVIVAVSGGADSLSLLHILKSIDLPLHLIAVYIDHGLRPQEIPHEKKIIENLCFTLGLPFIIRTVNVHELVAQGKNSPEEAARILRYQALEAVRKEYAATLICVGHTADDQVEEFFIRLIRGSSSRGLSGMRLKRDHIVRPLLFENKAILIEYLSGLGLPWCRDSSNLERQFLRNRVRLDLLPLLEQHFNPALRKTVLQSMDVLLEEDKFLEIQTLEAFRRCCEIDEFPSRGEKRCQLIINRAKFLETHPAIRRRIMEKSCWRVGIRPSYEKICSLIELIEFGRKGSELHLEDGVRAEKLTSNLLLSRPLPQGQIRGSRQAAPAINQTLPGPGIYPVIEANKEIVLEETSVTEGHKRAEGELLLDLAEIAFPLQLRSVLPGERFHPFGSPGSKKISRYFNERQIPPRDRQAWPVLFSGDRVIAIAGLQLDHNFRVTTETRNVLSIRWRDCKKQL